MPKVGKKSFPYTELGEKSAKAYAKKTGKSVKKMNAKHEKSESPAMKAKEKKRGGRS
jgi:hypothetical protein